MNLDLLLIKEAKYIKTEKPKDKHIAGILWCVIGTIALVATIIWFCFELVRQLF